MHRGTLLLHICCAPCMPHVVDVLKQDFAVTAFYFNPNIYPPDEYQKRLTEVKSFSQKAEIPLMENEYSPHDWVEAVKGMEQEKEGGKRCVLCYTFRLKAAADKAQELKFDYFTTVLSISPHKNAALINQIGESLAAERGVKFYSADFKKKDGFKISMQRAKELNFYRQNYCGCVYSQRTTAPA